MRSVSSRGVTLIDVLVGSALVVIIFLGLFAIVRASLAVSTLAKLKSTASTIASTQMEYIRSLPYSSVGTVGGIPAGLAAQNATTTVGGVTFSTRTFIEYADDPADGTGASDTNGIITDYKHIKVSTTYVANNSVRDVTMVSNVAPPGIETTTGGGTIRVTVVNALGAAVSGASVRIVNASTSPTVDVTTFTDTAGIVYLPGAATSTQYQVYVSKSGYSSAQTYLRDTTNQNPTPGYLTVAANQTTTGTFAIDLLSTLTFRTFTPIRDFQFFDTFTDASGITTASSVSVSGGAVVLSGTPGFYAGSGSVTASTTAPTRLASWVSASSTLATPAGTDVRVYVADATGTRLTDAVLPGNGAGFTGVIDLSGIATTTYPSLQLQADFGTSDPNQTSSLLDWGIGYTAGPTPLPNVAFTLTGGKTVGSTGAGTAIYKTTVASTTDASGARTMNLEWDSYELSVPGEVIVSEDPELPFELLPGTTLDARVILEP